MVLGVCLIQSGQTITYKVNHDFDYHVVVQPNATVEFESKNPGDTINIKGNIWGGGHININCFINMQGSFSPPPESELSGLQVYTYSGDPVYTEEIN